MMRAKVQVISAAMVALAFGTAQTLAETKEKSGLVRPTEKDYCTSFADAAKEARYQRQKEDLAALQAEVSQQLAELRRRTDVLQKAIAERQAMQDRANATLVKIYSGMEAEAAVGHLSKIEIGIVAELLSRLSAKQAAALLAAMEPKLAARIVKLMSRDLKKKEES